MSSTAKSRILSWAQIAVGLFLAACAYRMFLIPNEIAPGGFTGISQLVHKFTGWPIGWINVCLNVPLFALSFKALGMKFGIKSLVAMLGLSLSIDYFTFLRQVTSDSMLAAVFGGVIAGVGFGLILRGGATTGGSDMLGTLLNRRLKVVRVSVLTFCVDALVIVASGFVFDLTKAMFALISAFLFSQLLDMVLEGPNSAKVYYIISNKNVEIADRILHEMDRGVTALQGVGMYSRDERVVLLCVINRFETIRLRTIVAELDPGAFLIATNVHEVLGEGFKPHL